MRNTELLIPASSLEVLKTAVLYGADAVYIGGEMYGLRAKARNFSKEDMKEGVAFAHENGVKVYVTANIVAHNEDLEVGWEQAEKIIVIGNGVDKNGYPLIEQFAKQINAEIAGTRRAVENGLLPVERMIGISGKSISPKLCIVIGASGLAAFVKGIEKSECIVSINSDKDALIFKYADYGIIGHYQEVITVT